MRKDNNVNYNTDQSNIRPFSDINQEKEKNSLEKDKRNFLKNDDGRYNLPNKKKMRYNKVTKTWQDVSKKEIKDKIKYIEKINIKTFHEIINEDQYAFGDKELNSETFLSDLEKDIYKHKGEMAQVKNSIAGNPHMLNIINEIEIHFNEMLDLIKSRHDNYLKREGF